VFPKVTLHLGHGKTFGIEAWGVSSANKYVLPQSTRPGMGPARRDCERWKAYADDGCNPGIVAIGARTTIRF
jgi:hypothetical protein